MKKKINLTEKKNQNHSKELEADIVVIGAGSAGLCAANKSAALGARVIILEKMPFPGGYSLMAEGMFAVESIFQKIENIDLNRDEAYLNHMESTHWNANAGLVKAFIDKSASTINWLMEMGVAYEKVWALWPGGPRTWHLMKGGGKALIDALAHKLKENSVQLFLETPVTDIVKDEKNRIIGVMAQDKDGTCIKINSPVVIVAGGGFASNKEMIKKFTGIHFEFHTLIEMKQTGEHIRMAWEIGAAPRGQNVTLSIPAVVGEPPRSHLWAAAIQPLLWVNWEGERFCNESTAFQFPLMANALANQKDGILFTIFDEFTKRKLIEKGIDASVGVFVPAATKLDRLEEDIKRGIDEKKVFTANSLKELSNKMEINHDNFKDTINKYNICCNNNYDSHFAKCHRYLLPVERTPFYAVKCSFHIFTTLGGIRINQKTEVLDKSFSVIPGLYAAGNCAGGMYGFDYDVVTSGGALGFAVNSGLIAAENAFQYLDSQ